MKVVNLGDTEFHINKNRKLAILEETVSYNGKFQYESVYSDEICQIDHTDLKWSTDIDLLHLNINLREKV